MSAVWLRCPKSLQHVATLCWLLMTASTSLDQRFTRHTLPVQRWNRRIHIKTSSRKPKDDMIRDVPKAQLLLFWARRQQCHLLQVSGWVSQFAEKRWLHFHWGWTRTRMTWNDSKNPMTPRSNTYSSQAVEKIYILFPELEVSHYCNILNILQPIQMFMPLRSQKPVSCPTLHAGPRSPEESCQVFKSFYQFHESRGASTLIVMGDHYHCDLLWHNNYPLILSNSPMVLRVLKDHGQHIPWFGGPGAGHCRCQCCRSGAGARRGRGLRREPRRRERRGSRQWGHGWRRAAARAKLEGSFGQVEGQGTALITFSIFLSIV